MRKSDPIHSGETLLEDFLKPNNLSATNLAKILNVPQNRISDIVRCRRSISADTALRLERAFGATAQFWLNLQQHYDLIIASQKAFELDKIKKVAA